MNTKLEQAKGIIKELFSTYLKWFESEYDTVAIPRYTASYLLSEDKGGTRIHSLSESTCLHHYIWISESQYERIDYIPDYCVNHSFDAGEIKGILEKLTWIVKTARKAEKEWELISDLTSLKEEVEKFIRDDSLKMIEEEDNVYLEDMLDNPNDLRYLEPNVISQVYHVILKGETGIPADLYMIVIADNPLTLKRKIKAYLDTAFDSDFVWSELERYYILNGDIKYKMEMELEHPYIDRYNSIRYLNTEAYDYIHIY